MAHPHRLLSLLASLGLVACGSMADLEPAVPPPPPPPVEAPAAAPEPPVEPAVEVAPPVSQATEFDDTDPSAITDFKPQLDPYGVWVEDPTYGMVWVPAKSYVSADFAPYVSAGHWSTDANGDWLWVSDYDDSFGWVVFHYGRWVWVSDNGWVWIPGRRYAPAWVVWRTGDPGYDYIGWAPAPPGYYWRSGAVVWLDVYPPAPYVFCSTTYVFHTHVHQHIVPRDRVAAVAGPTHAYGSPSSASHHAPATPQRGPSVASGHVPSSSWPSAHTGPSPTHARFASPQAMGRPAAPSVLPKQSPDGVHGIHTGGSGPSLPGQTDQAHHGVAPSPGGDARRAPPPRAAEPGRAAPRPAAPGAQPSRSAPAQAPAPRAAPTPRAAPAPKAAPAPRAAPATRPSPAPSRPSQSSPSRSGSGRGKR